MGTLKEELDKVVTFLKPFLPLVNSHTVDFIVNDSWQCVTPENIRTEVDSIGVENILKNFWDRESENLEYQIDRFLEEAKKFELETTDFCISLDKLNLHSTGKNAIKITEFMSDKKTHEVEIMSQVVADVASSSNTSLVMDIGSGKGYLTSVLALQHGLKILGMDCSQVNINGATKTTMKLEKKWKLYERQALNTPKTLTNPGTKIVKESCSSNEEYYKKYRWRSAIIGDLYKQRVECISKNTNIANILDEEYPEENHQNVLLIGLHTCGNLAASCLDLFINNRNRIKSIINIGCCYHLIEEKFSVQPDCGEKESSHHECGFPMSNYLTNKGFALGRDARMCGTQKPLNVYQEEGITNATKPLFYRALLQKLMMDNLSPNDLPKGIVGRLAHKCSTFSEYATKALKKLNVDLQMNCEDLNKYERENIIHWDTLKVFFLLKAALSPVIETVILLDRLLYLFEKDVTNAFIVRLFNPVISPRCYAVVASSSDVSLTTKSREDLAP